MTYSLKTNGNDFIMPNFQVKEFRCKDGSDEILINIRLAYLLQRIRDHFGKPVHITSAYRTKAHNAAVGGAVKSQHLSGNAADITVSGVSPAKVADFAETLLPNTGGIGRYQNFTHVDVRASRARWSG